MSVTLTKNQPVKPAAQVLADIAAQLGGQVIAIGGATPTLFAGAAAIAATEVPELYGYVVEVHTFDTATRQIDQQVTTWVSNVAELHRIAGRWIVAQAVAA